MYHRSVPRIGGVAALSGKRVAVFGAGMEGQSFARRIGPSCAEIVVLDDLAGGRPASGGPGPSALGVDLADLNVRSPAVLAETRFDFVVHSPGVSRFDERLVDARRLGAVVTTPTALFMEDFADRQVVAVTGSKGKTTTAMLTVAVLRAHGLDVALAGNIGRPVTELYDDAAHDVFVVELSSFQTAEVTTSPTVGVLTLLAPDHLDWHRSIENYYADKLRLFSQRSDVPVAVNGCCDQAVARAQSWAGGSSTEREARCASRAPGSSPPGSVLSSSTAFASSGGTTCSMPAGRSQPGCCSPAACPTAGAWRTSSAP